MPTVEQILAFMQKNPDLVKFEVQKVRKRRKVGGKREDKQTNTTKKNKRSGEKSNRQSHVSKNKIDEDARLNMLSGSKTETGHGLQQNSKNRHEGDLHGLDMAISKNILNAGSSQAMENTLQKKKSTAAKKEQRDRKVTRIKQEVTKTQEMLPALQHECAHVMQKSHFLPHQNKKRKSQKKAKNLPKLDNSLKLHAIKIEEPDNQFQDETNGQMHVALQSYPEYGEFFKCLLCNTEFPTKMMLDLHLNSKHADRNLRYMCMQENCGWKFSTASSLLHHHNLKHPDVKISEISKSCHLCSKTFTTSRALTKHLEAVHTKNKTFKCKICEKCFNSKDNLAQHVKLHSDVRQFHCEEASCKLLFFKSNSSLMSHKRHCHTPHMRTRYICQHCQKGSTSLWNLRMHSILCLGHKPYTCSLCHESFRSTSAYRRHYKRVRSHNWNGNPKDIPKSMTDHDLINMCYNRCIASKLL